MGDGNYKLMIELLLKDRLSGGLSKSEVRLRLFGRESKQALQAYKQLRAELAKAMPHLNMPRITTPGGASKGGVGNARQEIQFLHQQTKLRQEQARLSGIESRNKAQATQAGLRGLQQESRLRKEVNSEIQRGARDEIRLQREQLNLRQAQTKAIQSGELHDLRYQREQVRLQRQLAGSRREEQRGRRERIERGIQTVQTGVQIARGTFDTLAGFTDPALDMMRARQRFRLMGFPQDETMRGLSAVEDVTRQTRGVRRVDVQETMTSLVNSLGSVDEAIKFLPISAKYLANMQALHGDEYGPSEVTRQIKNTFKALETLGINRPTGPKDRTGQAAFTDEDHKRVERYFDIMAQASAATGGDINPNELRAFTRYSRMAGQGLSPEGLMQILPMIQELGGAQTGSAMMALYTNMVGGTIPAYKLRNWQDMGLLDMSKVEYSKGNKHAVSRLKPGAIPIAEGLSANPMVVADRLTEAFRKKGIDVSDTEAVNKQIISMFGNIRGAGAMAVMINQRALMSKEARNYERALGIGKTYGQIFDFHNPLGQIADRQTAWTNTQATSAEELAKLGGAASEQIATQLKALDAVAKDHPAYAAAALGVLSLGKASADAAGGVSLLGRASGGAVSGSGGGGGITPIDIGAGGWLAKQGWSLGSKAVAAGGGGALASTAGGALAILATAGLLGYAIKSNYQADKAEQAKSRQDALSSYESIKRSREQVGGRLPDEVARQLGETAFPGLGRGGALLVELSPKSYGTAGYPGLSVGTPRVNDEVIAGEFRRRAPELEFPEVFRSFFEDVNRQIKSGLITPEQGSRTKQIAQTAYPEVYKQNIGTGVRWADQVLGIGNASEQMMALVKPTADATQGLTNLNQPLTGLPTQLNNFGTSLQGAADKINSLEINGPTFGGGSSTPALRYLGFGGHRAKGGRVLKDISYIGGERGPELFTPNRDGFVIPNHRLLSAARWRDETTRLTSVSIAQRLAARQPLQIPAMRGNGSNSGGGDVHIHINVPPGSAAAENPTRFVKEVRAELRQEIAELSGLVKSPRHIGRMYSRHYEEEDERS